MGILYLDAFARTFLKSAQKKQFKTSSNLLQEEKGILSKRDEDPNKADGDSGRQTMSPPSVLTEDEEEQKEEEEADKAKEPSPEVRALERLTSAHDMATEGGGGGEVAEAAEAAEAAQGEEAQT